MPLLFSNDRNHNNCMPSFSQLLLLAVIIYIYIYIYIYSNILEWNIIEKNIWPRGNSNLLVGGISSQQTVNMQPFLGMHDGLEDIA